MNTCVVLGEVIGMSEWNLKILIGSRGHYEYHFKISISWIWGVIMISSMKIKDHGL